MNKDHYTCVVKLLIRLGKTIEEIETKLRSMQISGTLYSFRDNPLSKYIEHRCRENISFRRHCNDEGIGMFTTHHYELAIAIGHDVYMYYNKPELVAAMSFLRQHELGKPGFFE